jgi:hypothetical protein
MDATVVTNLRLSFIEVTSLGVIVSGIPPQGACGSSIHVDWQTMVVAHHHRELEGCSKPTDVGDLQ